MKIRDSICLLIRTTSPDCFEYVMKIKFIKEDCWIKRKKTPALKESDIQSTYFKILQMYSWKYPFLRWVHASMNGASASSKTAAALRKRQGQIPGIWDVMIPIPIQRTPGAWIEFKAGKGKLTEFQREFQDHLIISGYKYAVCHSVDEAIEFTENYLNIRLL